MKNNLNFLDWFVGFSEGDGSFTNPKNGKLRFELCQHSKDAQVLNYIKSELGFGEVIFPGYRPNIAVFIVTKSEHLNILKSIFISRICTLNTYTRFKPFFNISDQNPILLQKPNLNSAWLSGFIDAEGCFRIKIESNNTIKLLFEISQKDSELIHSIREIFNLKSNIWFDKEICKLAFSGKMPKGLLIDYLNKFPLKSHKQIIFNKWNEANNILLDKDRYKNEGKLKIISLSKDLNNWRDSPNHNESYGVELKK